MPTGVEYTIQKQCDHLAAIKSTLVSSISSRVKLKSFINAETDQIYNDVIDDLQWDMMDDVIDFVQIGSLLANFFSGHRDYFQTALSINSFDNYLLSVKWRVNQYLSELKAEAQGTGFDPRNVFPKHDLNMGSFARTGSIFTPGQQVDMDLATGGKIMGKANGAIGGSNLTLTCTMLREDNTLVSVAITFPSSSTSGTQKVIGEQALTANVLAGTPLLPVAATAQFVVNSRVLIQDANNTEWGEVGAINSNASLILKTPLKKPYNTSDSAKVTPVFTMVTNVTDGGTGTIGDQVLFKISPDRAVSIT